MQVLPGDQVRVPLYRVERVCVVESIHTHIGVLIPAYPHGPENILT